MQREQKSCRGDQNRVEVLPMIMEFDYNRDDKKGIKNVGKQ